MPKRKKYIGVFDSGFGGIHILRSMIKTLPRYQYVYLADTARAPYGTRSAQTVYALTKQAVDFLFAQGCKLVILACNTASSEALRKIQQEHLPLHHPGKRVLGVLVPAAEEAVKKTRNKKIGVIATEGTVRSGAFIRELVQRDPDVRVFQQSCPLLVPLIEAGEERSPPGSLILENYLRPLKRRGVDTLVLGCTHYGILETSIKKSMGTSVALVSEARIVPQKLKAYLDRHPEIERNLLRKERVLFNRFDGCIYQTWESVFW